MKAIKFGMVFVAALMLSVGAMAGEGAKITDHKVKDIDGNEVDLSKYEGKVLMVVNVASKCGLTPQYEQLVALHKQYQDKGFEILGFPANNFLGQEPGTEEDIKTFCSTKYGVEFPMFSKISVHDSKEVECTHTGGLKASDEEIAPLYQELISKEENGEFGGEIQWNFTKFLVNKEGKVVARFDSRTKPDAPEVVAAIEKELEG